MDTFSTTHEGSRQEVQYQVDASRKSQCLLRAPTRTIGASNVMTLDFEKRARQSLNFKR
jgi:hypothetical protein